MPIEWKTESLLNAAHCGELQDSANTKLYYTQVKDNVQEKDRLKPSTLAEFDYVLKKFEGAIALLMSENLPTYPVTLESLLLMAKITLLMDDFKAHPGLHHRQCRC